MEKQEPLIKPYGALDFFLATVLLLVLGAIILALIVFVILNAGPERASLPWAP